MRPRALLVPALLVAAGGIAYTQPAPQTVPPTLPDARLPSLPGGPVSSSLDQLLDRLEALRAQKADLERQEQEVVKEIRRKVEKQSDRLQRLGVNEPFVPPPPPSVSFAPTVIPALPAVPAAPPVIPPVQLPTAPGR